MAPQNMSVTSFFAARKIPVGIYPLMGIMGFAVSGASYFVYHSVLGPEIQLNRNKEAPNLSIQPHQTPKFWNPNGRFQEYWHRS
jgi:hypothetical protein